MVSELLSSIERMDEARVLVVGDVMLDVYVYGAIHRISPEAPVPVLRIDQTREMLGGAGNVITNLCSLGAKTCLMGIVGRDQNGQKVKHILQEIPNAQSFLADLPSVPTITKTRFVSSSQQLLRVDSEKVISASDFDESEFAAQFRDQLDQYNVVILSDYKKGLLTPKLCQALIQIAVAKGIPVFVDPKGVDYSIYSNATLVKPNLRELKDAFPGEDVTANIVAYARKLLKNFSIRYCLVTMGSEGMWFVSSESETHLPAKERKVFDVSGAGDTVISTLAASYSVGAEIADACYLSNIAGGIVVEKPGTATVARFEIEREIEARNKLYKLSVLKQQVEAWKSAGLKVGFTNGCFDILHTGHIQTINFARRNCDRLIVATNSDTSISLLKGKTRPINNERARLTILSELASVDAIIVFDASSPEGLIHELTPDVLVKGSDYKEAEVDGHEFVKSYGGKLLLAPFVKDASTTNIISKIQAG